MHAPSPWAGEIVMMGSLSKNRNKVMQRDDTSLSRDTMIVPALLDAGVEHQAGVAKQDGTDRGEGAEGLVPHDGRLAGTSIGHDRPKGGTESHHHQQPQYLVFSAVLKLHRVNLLRLLPTGASNLGGGNPLLPSRSIESQTNRLPPEMVVLLSAAGRQHILGIGMVSGISIAMLKLNTISRAEDKYPALLPEVAGGQALEIALTQGSGATRQRCRPQGFPEPASKPESLEGQKLSIQIQFSREIEVFRETPGLRRRAAADGDQRDARLVQLVLDAHHGSRLLPAKHSSEMAQKNKRDPSVLPKGIHGHRCRIEIQNAHSPDTFKYIGIFHVILLP
jgi:hypothetical protein